MARPKKFSRLNLQKVFPFCRISRAVFIFLLFLLAAVFYAYYWSSLPEVVNAPEITEEPVVEQQDFPEEITEIIVEEDEEPVEILQQGFQDFEKHLQLKVDSSKQPEPYDVLHISRLVSLEKYFEAKQQGKKIQNLPFSRSGKQVKFPVKIAIVIDDMGASPSRSNEISAIKAPLTSSFVTFASRLNHQVEKAKKSGHEIMIHVPMQPKSDIFVSDDVLTVKMSATQISDAFEKMLKKFKDAVGVNNHMGSELTEHSDKLIPVMKLLAKNKMFFLDSKTTPNSQGEATAKKYGVPSVHRDVFLDNHNDLEYILGQLEKTEKIAQKEGYAVAIGHPKTQTVRALKVWIKTLKDKNIRLVPLSEIVYAELAPE